MKKLLALFLAAALLAPCIALAYQFDLASMTDEELSSLYKTLAAELVKRSKSATIPPGTYVVGTQIPAGTYQSEPVKSLCVVTRQGTEEFDFMMHMLSKGESLGSIILKTGDELSITGGSLILTKFMGITFD